MKIAIDISPLKSPHQYRGVGFYTRNLISALKKYQPENQYIFFTRTAELPKDVDLVHYPFFDPFFLTLPFFKPHKIVVTIHDLIPLIFPDKFPRGLKGEIKWQIQRLSLKSVSAVITDSNVSKRDIVKLTGFPRERVFTIHLAPGDEFKPIKKNSVVQTTKLKYNLPQRFVLYVGDINWNKNIPGLIRAFKELKMENEKLKTTRKNLKLVLVGKAFLDNQLKEANEIDQLITNLQIKDSVLKLGFVSTKDLVEIYNLAAVYCQPSFYEGFGLPVLEAMACGTPVVAADIPSLRKILARAAIYVNPNDISDVALGMKQALELSGLNHLTLVKESLKQAKKFSWKKVAKETVRVYKRIAV